MSAPNIEGSNNPQALSGGEFGVLPPVYTLATLPTTVATYSVAVCSNANSGVGTVVFYNGTNWIDVKTGLTAA